MYVALCSYAHTPSRRVLRLRLPSLSHNKGSSKQVLKRTGIEIKKTPPTPSLKTGQCKLSLGQTMLNDVDIGFSQGSSKSPRELDVFLHDRDSFRV